MMMKKITSLALSALAASGVTFAQTSSTQLRNIQHEINHLQGEIAHGHHIIAGGIMSTNPKLSHMMLNHQHSTGSELSLLKARQKSHLANGLTVGGALEADAIWQHKNNGKAIFLNPSLSASGTKKSASRITLTNLDLQFIAAINPWVTAYVNMEHLGGMTGSFPKSKGHSVPTLIFNKAYLLIGNLNRSPIYGLVGRNDIDFGQFASVNPYSMPLNRIGFQANGEVASVGIDTHGFNATVSAMNGGNQTNFIYASNWFLIQNLNTVSGSNNISNFAFNAGYGMKLHNGFAFHAGMGLLKGSRFKAKDGKTNGAWDVNARLDFAHIELLGEFTQTFKKTDKKPAYTHAAAWQAAAAYHFPLLGHKTTASLSYSASNKGIAGTHSASQYVAGLRSDIFKNVSTGLEYAYNTEGADRYNTVVLDLTATF